MNVRDLRHLTAVLEEKFTGSGEPRFFRAPGRVNLIGGHTDYNDGFVMPVAINREMLVAARPRDDRIVKVYSCNFEDARSFNLDRIEFNREVVWINYIQGVAEFLQESGCSPGGLDIVLQGRVPLGAGLSSSAALEVAVALAFSKIFELEIEDVKLASIARRAENEFVGVNCGIMDQFISVLGRKDRALFLDCRTRDYELIPIKDSSFKIVVANTNVEHKLAESAYNRRLQECQQGVEKLASLLEGKIQKLRDVSPDEFNAVKDKLPEVIRNRCQHVISENQRVKDCCRALLDNNLERAGELISLSHQSLSSLYEVSCAELDLMIDIALNIEGVLGARMTGAGFGGSTVNLVENQVVSEFKTRLVREYNDKTGIDPDIYICEIVDGCSEIPVNWNEKIRNKHNNQS